MDARTLLTTGNPGYDRLGGALSGLEVAPGEEFTKSSSSYVLTTKGKPDVPPICHELWNGEAYTTAQLVNGVDANTLFGEIGRLFPAEKKYGVYAYDPSQPNVRLGERESVKLRTYLDHVEAHGPLITGSTMNLAQLHLLTCKSYRVLYSEEEIDKTLQFSGLAVAESARGTGLAKRLLYAAIEGQLKPASRGSW